MRRWADQSRVRSGERGLTLFELLVVLAIIALLATIIAPRVIGYLGRAKSDVARSQLASLSTSVELFYFDVGRYPTKAESLGALVSAPSGAAAWRGPYLKDVSGLSDPWGRPYGYEADAAAEKFRVFTLGRDGAVGGNGEDADISKN